MIRAGTAGLAGPAGLASLILVGQDFTVGPDFTVGHILLSGFNKVGVGWVVQQSCFHHDEWWDMAHMWLLTQSL